METVLRFEIRQFAVFFDLSDNEGNIESGCRVHDGSVVEAAAIITMLMERFQPASHRIEFSI